MEIIFIAFELPPIKAGGIYRSAAFLKYLRDFGITPIVITLSKKSIIRHYAKSSIDEDLSNNILFDHIVYEVDSTFQHTHKNKFVNFLDYYLHPNGREAKYWEKHFQLTIEEVIKVHNPKCIFVTAPPFSIVSLAINASRKYNLPLVLDLRDAWSNWILRPYGSIFHYWIKKNNEKVALRNASKIITTSLQTEADLISSNPNINSSKFRYIPNGYEQISVEWKPVLNKGVKKNRIGYVGSFYYDPIARDTMLKKWYQKKGHRMFQYVPNVQDWKYRSPYFVFRTIFTLIQMYPEYKNRISLEFVGENPQWLSDMINEFCLSDIFTHYGTMTHKDSLEFQLNMDALLLTSAKIINGRDYSIAGKTYEYFQNQKPILAFVCEGAQKDILEKSGMAVIFNPDNLENSVLLLKQFIDGEINLQPDMNFISQFNRKHLTKKLADLISEL